MKLVTRDEWGAAPPRGSYSPLRNAKGVVVHWFGGETPANDHANCAQLVRSIQQGAFSRTDGTYVDIEYNLLACVHGYVFVGRGVGVEPAAQADGNAEYFAVCALTGPSGGMTSPTPELETAIMDAITDLRQTGPAGPEIIGHRDLMSTDCPGDALEQWVKQGAPHGAPDPTPSPGPAELGSRQLELGSSGTDVEWLQHNIGVPADGKFGPQTQGGVMAWQHGHGLANDGVVGPNTWRALGHPMAGH